MTKEERLAKRKRYSKTLNEQVHQNLVNRLAESESKRVAKENGTADGKIFSYSTYHDYKRACYRFTDWIKRKHPDETSLKKCKKYVLEYFNDEEQKIQPDGTPYSAWTISLWGMALCKLYDINKFDYLYPDLPERRRDDIIRSREKVTADKRFEGSQWDDLKNFLRATGLRRCEAEELRPEHLMNRDDIKLEICNLEHRSGMNSYDWFQYLDAIRDANRFEYEQEARDCIRRSEAKSKLTIEERSRLRLLDESIMFDEQWFIDVPNAKGGRMRLSPIIGENAERVAERIRNTPDGKRVLGDIEKHFDIHSYRAEYATNLYKYHCRDVRDIPMGQRYIMREGTMSGRILDKFAMRMTSKALGHDRIEIVANNYIR